MMIAKLLYIFLFILFIIVSILLGSTHCIPKSTIEEFNKQSNQYITDLKISRDAINSNLYNRSILNKQDPEVYAFESNILLGEERTYNTEVYDCREVWGNWSDCDRSKIVCDGYNRSIISTRKRTLLSRFPARNGGTPCQNDIMVCTLENVCPVVNTLEFCQEWQRAVPTDHHCLIVNSSIYLDGGLYTRNFVDGNDTCIIALSLWKENEAYWTGMVCIGNREYRAFNEISNSGGIEVRGQWGTVGHNNIVVTAKCEKYRAVILVSKNDFEKVTYPTYTINARNNVGNGIGNDFGIYMNGGEMFDRNFINWGDLCIFALTMWTNSGKSWTGFVGVNHMIYPGNQSFLELWKNNVEIQSGWGPWGDNYTMFRGVNNSDGGAYYRVNVLISKNDFNDIKYTTYTAEWRTLSLGFVIDMTKMFGRNLVENKDQIMIAIVIWTNKAKGWSGFVSINNSVKPGNQNFKDIWKSGLTLSSNGQDFIVINGADSNETVYYRANILNSKNKIQPS